VRVLLILIGVAMVAWPIQAIAKPKPKIAVAPLDGDAGNKVALAIAEALDGKDFEVVGPKEVSREMKKLGLADELAPKDARKLATKLEAVALVDGKVAKAGKKRSLHLEVHRRGKPDAGFTIEFKSTASDGFRRGVHDEIAKKLEGAGDDAPADDDDPGKKPAGDDRKRSLDDDDDHLPERKKRTDDDDHLPERKKRTDDDDHLPERKKRTDDDDHLPERKKRTDDDDHLPERKKRTTGDNQLPERKKKVATTTDDDEPAVRKRKGRKQAEAEVAPQVLARVGGGGLLAQRRLTYDTRAGLTPAQAPPSVVTTAGAFRIDGEIYPFALANPRGGIAGLGLAGAYDKTFGLAIKIPNMALQAPIDQAHFAIGARYRFGVGEASAITIGLDYVGRHYIADRSSLMMVVLDAPDVDYAAIAPGIAARTPVTPTITLFGALDGMLVLDTGPIQKSASYGAATVYGVEVLGGLDIAIAKQLGLRVALEYSQINFTFNGKGTMATGRDNDSTTVDVNGATDRSIGLSATLGLAY
jgi:hypothetical protein